MNNLIEYDNVKKFIDEDIIDKYIKYNSNINMNHSGGATSIFSSDNITETLFQILGHIKLNASTGTDINSDESNYETNIANIDITKYNISDIIDTSSKKNINIETLKSNPVYFILLDKTTNGLLSKNLISCFEGNKTIQDSYNAYITSISSSEQSEKCPREQYHFASLMCNIAKSMPSTYDDKISNFIKTQIINNENKNSNMSGGDDTLNILIGIASLILLFLIYIL